jgi:DNA repair exonuclease SbcCD ATPase subunit
MKKIADAEHAYNTANTDLFKSKALLQECIEADNKLKKANAGDAIPAGRTVDEINEDLRKVKEQKRLIEVKAEAYEIAKKITKLVAIVNALAPEGIKAEKLREKLSLFNKKLLDICKTTLWKTVEVKENLDIYYGSRRYGILLSDSERYRVNIALQVAIADFDKSDVIVIDGADILDADGRNGLVKLLKKRLALVCMTIPNREIMPDFSAVGGNSYWIAEGEVK